jgi:hypothetical protein
VTHVEGLRGKLLLVHGLIDENVHFRHTARLINALIGPQDLRPAALPRRAPPRAAWPTGSTWKSVGALLHDPPAFDDADAVCVADGAQAVGDHHAVRPASSRSSASWISTSVTVSTLAVASSRIRMRGSASTARAMQINWRWPTDRFTPPSRMRVS